MTVRKKAGKTAGKAATKTVTDNARLLEIGRRLAANQAHWLANSLKNFGAKPSALLLPEGERLKRWTSTLDNRPRRVCIPLMDADMIAAILLSLAEESTRGPGKRWPSEIRDMAWTGLIERKKLDPLAREISAKTGQPFPSTRRRLQEMNADAALKEAREVVERARRQEAIRTRAK